MNKFTLNHRKHRQQTGSALLVSVIIIFMLSIMGVSAMRDATLERRMATNSIQSATAFHSAESNTDMVLNNRDDFAELLNNVDYDNIENGILPEADRVTVNIDLLQNIGLTTEAEYEFVGMGVATGYSSDYAAYRFEVVGKSSVDAVRAKSEVKQGGYIVARRQGP